MTDFLVLEDALAAGPAGPIQFDAGRLISDDIFDVVQLATQGVPLLQYDPLTMAAARDGFLRARGAQAKPRAINGDLSSLLIASGVIRPIPPGAVLAFGNATIASTTTTRFLDPWSHDDSAPTVAQPFSLPRSGRIRNFLVRQQGSGNGNPVVYTLLLNGAPTVFTLSLATTVPITGVDTTNIITVAQEDEITVEVAKAVGIGSNPGPVICSMEFI